MDAVQSRLREWRRRRGLSQQALAEAAGVARQTVSGVEAGRYGPSVQVGLRLARALGCRVEDLFALPGEEAVPAAAGALAPDERVALADIAGRTVARSLHGLGDARWATPAAHGIVVGMQAAGQPRVAVLAPRRGVFLAGCDPALGLLAAHCARQAVDLDAYWWHAGNGEAVAQLQRGQVHAAGLHHPAGEPSGAGPRFRIAAWQTGWMVRRGNPKGIRGAPDLLRRGVVLANREPGSGARALLDRLLAADGVPTDGVTGYATGFEGHLRAGEAVLLGAADAALGLHAAATALGLDFVPVVEEVCDLCLVPGRDQAAGALLEALRSAAFRTELSAFGPYDTSRTGEHVA